MKNGTAVAPAALLARLQRAESELQLEKHRRRMAEQSNAGLRSACSRLSALLQRARADAALKQAEKPKANGQHEEARC
jgi:hypothetical protein